VKRARLRPADVVLSGPHVREVRAALACVGRDGAGVVLEEEPLLLAKAEQALRDPRMSYLLGDFEVVPLPNGSVDAVIGTAWDWAARPCSAQESFRVLRSGGSLCFGHAVADADPDVARLQALLKESPPDEEFAEYDFLGWIEAAGFVDIETAVVRREQEVPAEIWASRESIFGDEQLLTAFGLSDRGDEVSRLARKIDDKQGKKLTSTTQWITAVKP
jgi:SAM-dependent methyltransferase